MSEHDKTHRRRINCAACTIFSTRSNIKEQSTASQKQQQKKATQEQNPLFVTSRNQPTQTHSHTPGRIEGKTCQKQFRKRVVVQARGQDKSVSMQANASALCVK